MNGSSVIMGAMAAASIALVGFLIYRIRGLTDEPNYSDMLLFLDDSSLAEDFNDIMGFIPLGEVREIIKKYMKFDPQIRETVSFINDQKRHILREFQKMPQITRLLNFLRENGVDVDYYFQKIQSFWEALPRFIRTDPSIASGGLTAMISKILKTIPRNELQELLHQKVKYSRSFHRFLQVLASEDINELFNAIKENDVLQHHFFWAKESGLEITFALILFEDFYVYLTEDLLSSRVLPNTFF